MNKEISKEDFIEGLNETGHNINEETINEAIKRGYFYATPEGYQDPDCIEVEEVGEMIIARFE